jgi:hypothetical protein
VPFQVKKLRIKAFVSHLGLCCLTYKLMCLFCRMFEPWALCYAHHWLIVNWSLYCCLIMNGMLILFDFCTGTLSCSVLLRTCIALLISNWHWGIEPSSSCSLETRPVIWPGKLSEVLLKRHWLCMFIFVPSRKSPHLRQLVEGRDKQSIPHYSVSLLLAPITWL